MAQDPNDRADGVQLVADMGGPAGLDDHSGGPHTISPKIITVLTRYRPIFWN